MPVNDSKIKNLVNVKKKLFIFLYTFTNKKGATGGVLYYELAPNRPDLVLKDMIHILHPSELKEYQPYFFEILK